MLADIPVIMLTIVDDKNMGYALGASEYLTKPIDRDRLAAVLKQYRRRGRSRGRLLVVEDDADTREMIRRDAGAGRAGRWSRRRTAASAWSGWRRSGPA